MRLWALVLLVLLAMRLMPGGIGWCLKAEDRSEALHVMTSAVICCDHRMQMVESRLADGGCCSSVPDAEAQEKQNDICCLSLDDDGQDQLPSHFPQAVAATQVQLLPPWRVASVTADSLVIIDYARGPPLEPFLTTTRLLI